MSALIADYGSVARHVWLTKALNERQKPNCKTARAANFCNRLRMSGLKSRSFFTLGWGK